jgi:hypothetical protein
MSDGRVPNAERGHMRSRSVFPRREGWARELNISGTHVVVALMIILCLLRLLVSHGMMSLAFLLALRP